RRLRVLGAPTINGLRHLHLGRLARHGLANLGVQRLLALHPLSICHLEKCQCPPAARPPCTSSHRSRRLSRSRRGAPSSGRAPCDPLPARGTVWSRRAPSRARPPRRTPRGGCP